MEGQLEYLVWGAVALVAVVFIFREQSHRNNRNSFNDLARAVAASKVTGQEKQRTPMPAASTSNDPSDRPDMYFAGRAFAQVALMRANDIGIDLHDVEQRLAEAEMEKGCTAHQALSMRWGGVQAIHADLAMYSAGVEVAQNSHRAEPYVDGGIAYLAMVLHQCPSEFQSFKQYLGATS